MNQAERGASNRKLEEVVEGGGRKGSHCDRAGTAPFLVRQPLKLGGQTLRQRL